MPVIEQKHVFIYRFIILNLVKVLSFIKSVENSLKQDNPNCHCLLKSKEKEEHTFLFKPGLSYFWNFFASFCKTSMVY